MHSRSTRFPFNLLFHFMSASLSLYRLYHHYLSHILNTTDWQFKLEPPVKGTPISKFVLPERGNPTSSWVTFKDDEVWATPRQMAMPLLLLFLSIVFSRLIFSFFLSPISEQSLSCDDNWFCLNAAVFTHSGALSVSPYTLLSFYFLLSFDAPGSLSSAPRSTVASQVAWSQCLIWPMGLN